MIEQKPCKYCKQPGTVACVESMYYARCVHCKKWPPFEFLGATKENAIKAWNESQSNQPKTKRKKL